MTGCMKAWNKHTPLLQTGYKRPCIKPEGTIVADKRGPDLLPLFICHAPPPVPALGRVAHDSLEYGVLADSH